MYINETYHTSLRNVHVAQTWIDQTNSFGYHCISRNHIVSMHRKAGSYTLSESGPRKLRF